MSDTKYLKSCFFKFWRCILNIHFRYLCLVSEVNFGDAVRNLLNRFSCFWVKFKNLKPQEILFCTGLIYYKFLSLLQYIILDNLA